LEETLRKKFGDGSVVSIHGGVNTRQRDENKKAFQNRSSPVRYLVGQTETGGKGLNLTAASFVIYYSNSFNLESRLQSEDRPQRKGQTEAVQYIDLVARNTVDDRLISKLRGKKQTANIVTGDDWKEWI
jgi:SNF2 family DNA or RNA helicase